jgi:hypothetical protein
MEAIVGRWNRSIKFCANSNNDNTSNGHYPDQIEIASFTNGIPLDKIPEDEHGRDQKDTRVSLSLE